MRLMVMFDLPTETAQDRKNYRQFRKALLSEGFIMMQESIYVRITVNKKAAELLEQRVAQVAPADGLIQTLTVTERQYASMKFMAGTPNTEIGNQDLKVVVI